VSTPTESDAVALTTESVGGRALIGAFWTASSQLAPYIYTTVTSIVAARVLGPEDMGRQSFIAFVVITVQTVCTTGLAHSISRYAGELTGQGRAGAIRSLASLGWRLAAPPSLVAAAALLLVAVGGAEPQAAWILGAAAVLAGGLHKVPAAVLIGGQRWRTQSVVVLVTGALSVVATIAVLAIGWGITGMLAVSAGVAITMLAWATLRMRRFVGEIPTPALPLGDVTKGVVRFALASSVPVVLSFVVLQRSEFFFLDHYSSDTQIALYSIAFSTVLALLALPGAVRMIVLPSVASLVGAGEFDRIRRGFSRLVRLSLLVMVPLTAGALALGPALLRLVYGEQYAGSGNVLLILLASLPLVALWSAGTALLMGYGRIRIPTLVSGFAALVDIGAAALFVPRLDAIGAAIANVLALIAATLPLLFYCHRLVGGIEVSLRHVARLTAVSAVAAGMARLVLEIGRGGGILVAALFVGVASFVFLALLLRVVPAVDANWIAGVADERGAHRIGRIARLLAS
jgi:O-antigen/teichoic acid export membrane protein